jgi:putative FmdB family regulatory protein
MLDPMPIYEYECAACATRFEELVRGPDAAVACPDCGGGEVQRLLSTFAGVGPSGAPAMPQHPRFAHRAAGGCCGGACGHHH